MRGEVGGGSDFFVDMFWRFFDGFFMDVRVDFKDIYVCRS